VKPDSDHFQVDVIAFGILFFELWHPFESDHERELVIEQLKKTRETPEYWSSIFPLQATIVKFALNSKNPNRFAFTLLGSKLLPSEEQIEDNQSLGTLMTAISAGPISLGSQSKELLDVLFAQSRRSLFQLFSVEAGFENRQDKFPLEIYNFTSLLPRFVFMKSTSSKILITTK